MISPPRSAWFREVVGEGFFHIRVYDARAKNTVDQGPLVDGALELAERVVIECVDDFVELLAHIVGRQCAGGRQRRRERQRRCDEGQ